MSDNRTVGLVRGRLRLRVLVASVLVTLVALAGFDFAAVTILRGYLLAQTDTALRTAARAALPQLTGHNVEGEAVWATSRLFLVDQYTLLYLADSKSGLMSEPPAAAWSPSVPDNIPVDLAGLVLNGQARDTTSYSGVPLRSVAVSGAGRALVISTTLDSVDHPVAQMRLVLIIGSAVALAFIGLGVFWLLRHGLRPIETMAAQADRITAGDLTDRVTEQDPRSEVGRLGIALNGMLARIEVSIHERESGQELMRRFFADASHELRTPLASLRANAELYQQGALPERPQVDEVMRRIGLEARRMSGLVDDMLRLARLDQHPDQRHELVDLTELVTGCVDRIRVAAPEHRWHSEIAAGILVVGDEELLRRAVDNLLANVGTHTPPTTSAAITLRHHGTTVDIEVSDTGPGVPPDQLPRIFDRFYRADTTTPRRGSGLGLAIVTQIASVHNGSLVAGPNRPRGLRVRLTLPVAGPFSLIHDSPAANA